MEGEGQRAEYNDCLEMLTDLITKSPRRMKVFDWNLTQ